MLQTGIRTAGLRYEIRQGREEIRNKKPYAELTKEELLALRNQLRAEYKRMQAKNLTLNMSRGNPCTEQLDLSMGMMDVMSSSSDMTCEDGTDCRNYGVLCGIPEAQELMGGDET